MPKNYMLVKNTFMLFVVGIFAALPFRESNNISTTWEITSPPYRPINPSWDSKSLSH